MQYSAAQPHSRALGGTDWHQKQCRHAQLHVHRPDEAPQCNQTLDLRTATNTLVDNYEIRFTFTDSEPSDRAAKGEWLSGLVIEHAKLNATSFEIEDCENGMYTNPMPYIQATPTIKSLPRDMNS